MLLNLSLKHPYINTVQRQPLHYLEMAQAVDDTQFAVNDNTTLWLGACWQIGDPSVKWVERSRPQNAHYNSGPCLSLATPPRLQRSTEGIE